MGIGELSGKLDDILMIFGGGGVGGNLVMD